MVESKNYLSAHESQPLSMESCEPPFEEAYKSLLEGVAEAGRSKEKESTVMMEECELPVIDLSRLSGGEEEKEECKREVARASEEWGFFQVVKHGISGELLERMRREQVKLFRKPFQQKGFHFSAGSYRWGTPSATCLAQLSWSEAFHVPLTDFSDSSATLATATATATTTTTLSSTMQQFAITVSDLAQKLAEILAERLGHDSKFFQENCLPSTCYLRMNRYPPCPLPSEVFGLMPHTDSDFLTILHQDQIGGLQLVKDGKWIAVKPNEEALIINIGDLFQAWSNGVYRSVEHRVVTNRLAERFSASYFFCPSYDTVIQSCIEPSIYREFSFREYRLQVQEDVKKFGHKIGLPRFLV